MPLVIPRPRLTPQMRILLRRMAPGLIGASAMQLNQVVDVIVASLLPPGAISLLYYADRVNQLPLGTIGAAVGTALLPLLSRQVRGPDPQAPINTLNRALEFALVLTIPAALALIVSGYPVLAVLFQRGAFDLHSALLASQSLAAYALGLPFFVLVKVLAPAFFARGDTTTPVRIAMITLVLNFALNPGFVHPAAACRPRACHQPGGDIQRRRPRHHAAPAWLLARGRSIAPAAATHRRRRSHHGCDALADPSACLQPGDDGARVALDRLGGPHRDRFAGLRHRWFGARRVLTPANSRPASSAAPHKHARLQRTCSRAAYHLQITSCPLVAAWRLRGPGCES